MNQPAVFVFERTAALREAVWQTLVRTGFEVTPSFDQAGLLRSVEGRKLDVVILGPSTVGPGNNLELARQIRQFSRTIPLILIASNSSEELAIAALRAGITEYIRYPCPAEELVSTVRRCLSESRVEQDAQDNNLAAHEWDGIVGDSVPMKDVRTRILRMASSDSNILVTGETGTGKELVAALVQKKSRRRHKPFIIINCAALPDSLLESELFGYEKGAFTGAQSSQEGKLKAADGGTVFLDEIGDMSAHGQAKILRVIEGREIQRLGKNGSISVNVRVIAATNQDLEQLVRAEKFRKDLFFRLNVARIHLPPLRERKEDVPALIEHYIRHFNAEFAQKVRCISSEVLAYLLAYDWPGNVRELKNLLESIFVDVPSADICLEQLPAQLRLRCMELKSASGDERDRLLWALSITDWNKSDAAAKLHWSRMTLYRKMARYNIVRASLPSHSSPHQ